MDRVNRYPLLLGACAVALITGCAQTGMQADSGRAGVGPNGALRAKVEPVYRVKQPVGTAAGQYAIGRIDLSEGRHEAAIRRFKAALQIDPNFVEAHNGLGVAFGQAGRFAEAAEAFRAALASGPAQAHLVNNLGFAQLKSGQLDEAWMSLRRAYDLDPLNAKTRENLVLLAEARKLAAARAAAASQRSGPVPAAEAAEAIPVAEAATIAEAPTIAPAIPLAPVAAVASAASAVPAAMMAPASSGAPAVAAEPASPAASVAAVEPASPAAALIAVAQAGAARLLGDTPNPRAYEVVVSRASDTELVQLTPGVYELRSNPLAIAAPAVAAPVPRPAAQVVGNAPKTSRVAIAAVRSYRVETRVATVPEMPSVRPVANPALPEAKVLTPPAASLKSVAGLEISNGVGLRSLAGRTARQLERFGASVARVSDYRSYGKSRTEIHYLAGHVAGAKALQQRLPVEAKLVEVSKMHPGVNVRLVVGRDMVAGPVAWWSEDPAVAGSASLARGEQLAPSMAQAVSAVPDRADQALVIAAPRGVELKPFAAKVARVDVEDGWRYL